MAADTVRRTMRVYDRDGRLMMKITGRPELELAYLGGDAWALRVDPQYRFDFVVEGSRATGFVYHERGTRFTGIRREGPPPGYADLPLAPGEAARLAGRYALGTTPLEIVESAGHLALRAADPRPLRLLKQGEGHFVVEADPQVVLRFTVTGGTVTLAYTQQGRALTGAKVP